MFLALQHSTHATIHDLVARALFLEAAILLLFISEISPSDTRGELSLVYCHCSCILLDKMRIFEGGNTGVLCSGISVEWMFTSTRLKYHCTVRQYFLLRKSSCLPPFAAVVAKRYKLKTMLWRAELHLNMSNIHKGTRLDSSHKHLCHRIKEVTTVF